MGHIYDGCSFVHDDYHRNSTFIIYFFSQVVILCAQFLFTSLVVQVPQNLAQAVSLRNIPRWIPGYVMSSFVPVFEFLFCFSFAGCMRFRDELPLYLLPMDVAVLSLPHPSIPRAEYILRFWTAW